MGDVFHELRCRLRHDDSDGPDFDPSCPEGC
jgi:hypothetical protein